MRLTRDSQGVLPFGAVSDGGYRGTGLHVFVESRSIEEAPGETTSMDKLEVEMLPDVAEGCVGVLVNNSAVRTEGELPAPSFEVERLPHEARVMVEVAQQELLVRAYAEFRRRDGYQARYALSWKAESAAGRYFWRPSRVYRGIQSAGVVNWSGGHSMRRPSLLRMVSQCSVITSGGSVSDAAV